jgi:hypothetical protein
VTVAYVIGFFVMLALIGFHPDAKPRGDIEPATQTAVIAY